MQNSCGQMSSPEPVEPSNVYVVIPVHNNVSYTLGCLRQLAKQSWTALKVVVIDDGSSDGTSSAVGQEFPEVDVVPGDGNLWWTGSMAEGVRHVSGLARPGDYLLTLNNDTFFAVDFVERLVTTSRNRGRAVVAATCFSSRDGSVLESAGKFLWSQARRIDNRQVMKLPNSDSEQYHFLSSRGVLYPIEVFARVGNFNSQLLPHYHGDVEFSDRARRQGFRLVLDDTSLMVYETPETSGDQFFVKSHLSLREAWKVITSPRSCYYPPAMFRYIDLCCPAPYRLLNKTTFLLAALSYSFGRTRPVAPLVRVARRMLGRP